MSNIDLNSLLNKPARKSPVPGVDIPFDENAVAAIIGRKPRKTHADNVAIVPPIDDEALPFEFADDKIENSKVDAAKERRLKKGKRVAEKERTVGTLTDEDKKFIDNSAGSIRVDEIAKAIGKKQHAVRHYMSQHGLLTDEDTRDLRVKRMIRNRLHNMPWWEMTKQAYTDLEIKRFEEEWCSQVIQMDQNLQPTEEIQLKQAIALSIQADRLDIAEMEAQKSAVVYSQKIEELKDEIDGLKGDFKDADDDMQDFLKAQLQIKQAEIQMNMQMQTAARQSFGAFMKDRKDMLATHRKLLEDLKATRDKRIDKFDISDKTWAKMLLDIRENPLLKKQMGAMAYISFLAVERMKAILHEPYVFADGETHPMILTPEDKYDTTLSELAESLYVPKQIDVTITEETTNNQGDSDEESKEASQDDQGA